MREYRIEVETKGDGTIVYWPQTKDYASDSWQYINNDGIAGPHSSHSTEEEARKIIEKHKQRQVEWDKRKTVDTKYIQVK